MVFVILLWHSLDLPYNQWREASMTGALHKFVMVDQDVPGRGVEVKEQHRVPWSEMVLGLGDPKPRQAEVTAQNESPVTRLYD